MFKYYCCCTLFNSFMFCSDCRQNIEWGAFHQCIWITKKFMHGLIGCQYFTFIIVFSMLWIILFCFVFDFESRNYVYWRRVSYYFVWIWLNFADSFLYEKVLESHVNSKNSCRHLLCIDLKGVLFIFSDAIAMSNIFVLLILYSGWVVLPVFIIE